METKKPKNSKLKAFVVGIVVGGVLFSSLSFMAINSNIDDIIDSKLSSSGISTQSSEASTISYTTTTEVVAEDVMPSVVGIETTEITMDMFNRAYESNAVGTGFIVDSSGLIATNQHVVGSNPESLIVTLKDGSSHEGTLIYASDVIDLAIIKIDADDLDAVKLGDSNDINVGQTAIAIGNPLGLTFERTVTQGIISAVNRSLPISDTEIAEDLIQTDASINEGNSGGPLLNSAGEVIGINTYKTEAEGMGFAIPINILKPILNQIVEEGSFTPTALGISGLDKELARYYTSSQDLTIEKGVLITGITKDSGAEDAGLKADDVITHINNVEINTMLDLREQLYYYKPGDEVEVTYERNGKVGSVEVELMEQE